MAVDVLAVVILLSDDMRERGLHPCLKGQVLHVLNFLAAQRLKVAGVERSQTVGKRRKASTVSI